MSDDDCLNVRGFVFWLSQYTSLKKHRNKTTEVAEWLLSVGTGEPIITTNYARRGIRAFPALLLDHFEVLKVETENGRQYLRLGRKR